MDKHSQLNIHNQDANDFLATTDLKFDLLVADIYHHDGIDDGQLKAEFITQSANLLTDSGWLVLNYWLDHDLSEALLDQFTSNIRLLICMQQWRRQYHYLCR